MTTTPGSFAEEFFRRKAMREYIKERNAKAQKIRDRINAAGIEYPSSWDEMGSSAKDLWEDRQIARLDRLNK